MYRKSYLKKWAWLGNSPGSHKSLGSEEYVQWEKRKKPKRLPNEKRLQVQRPNGCEQNVFLQLKDTTRKEMGMCVKKEEPNKGRVL